jgi:hypothetical protein
VLARPARRAAHPGAAGALHRVIPSSRNLFDWTDAQGNLVRYFFEGPIDPEIARHYFEEFHNKREIEAMGSFHAGVTGHATVRSAAELDSAAFYRSALYNEIWRPQGLHSRVEAIVKDARGLPLGSLVLYRGKDDPAFSADEEQLLSDLIPYVRARARAESTLSMDFVARRAPRDREPRRRRLAAAPLEDAHKMLLLSHGGIHARAPAAPRAAATSRHSACSPSRSALTSAPPATGSAHRRPTPGAASSTRRSRSWPWATRRARST